MQESLAAEQELRGEEAPSPKPPAAAPLWASRGTCWGTCSRGSQKAGVGASCCHRTSTGTSSITLAAPFLRLGVSLTEDDAPSSHMHFSLLQSTCSLEPLCSGGYKLWFLHV